MAKDKDSNAPEPEPVVPASADAAPSSTGVVAGDADEPREAPPAPTDQK
jgi:hypothetical protein